MANIVATQATGSNPSALALLSWTAATAGGDSFTMTGNDLLLVRNTGAGAVIVTVKSKPDVQVRTGDIAQSVAAGATRAFHFTRKSGWVTSGGTLEVSSATPADTQYAVVTLPAE